MFLFLLAGVSPAQAQGTPEIVGRIEGGDIALKGQVNLLREGNRSATMLASGAEVTVRTGTARITLEGGGELDICGPAQLTVLKSGGSVTLALSQGRVHARLGSALPVMIYTVLVMAAPIAVGDGARDAAIGVEADGSICILAARGAVRLEQQLTGQSLVVPENGEVLLPGGQLDALRENRGGCHCEANIAREEPPAPKPVQVGVVAESSGDGTKPEAAKKEPPKPATEEPKWTVVMPPLTFDAAKPPPALEPRPETILLVREVRVQPTLVFTGRVEKRPKIKAPKRQKGSAPGAEAPVQTSAAATASEAQPPASVGAATPAAGEKPAVVERRSGGGFGTKLRNFFRRLFGAKPKP